jgi:hypothetical protein
VADGSWTVRDRDGTPRTHGTLSVDGAGRLTNDQPIDAGEGQVLDLFTGDRRVSLPVGPESVLRLGAGRLAFPAEDELRHDLPVQSSDDPFSHELSSACSCGPFVLGITVFHRVPS